MDENLLLERLNRREFSAMEEVYSLYYDELNRFADRLYKNTEVVASDIIHDIFIHLWNSNKVQFERLADVKSYIYVCIRNKFRNYLTHKKSEHKYAVNFAFNEDYFVMGVAENEIYSEISNALDILPEDCSEVLSRLMDGWSISEIAEETGRPQRTIYNKRNEAIKILKKKMDVKTLALLLSALS